MTVVLLLVLCVAVTLALGFPLLLKQESRIPDYVSLGVLGAALLYSAWSWDAYWMLLAAAAIVAFVVWLDRQAPEPAAQLYDKRGWSDRTRFRMRLWLAAHFMSLAFIVGSVIVVATGARMVPLDLFVEGLLLSVAASYIFRFSFYNAAERDRRALAGADGAADRGPAESPASPAPFG